MTEALIEAAVPLLPALAIGWVASVSVGDSQMLTEPWYSSWVRLIGMTAICEVLGFVACRGAYRFFLLLL